MIQFEANNTIIIKSERNHTKEISLTFRRKLFHISRISLAAHLSCQGKFSSLSLCASRRLQSECSTTTNVNPNQYHCFLKPDSLVQTPKTTPRNKLLSTSSQNIVLSSCMEEYRLNSSHKVSDHEAPFKVRKYINTCKKLESCTNILVLLTWGIPHLSSRAMENTSFFDLLSNSSSTMDYCEHNLNGIHKTIDA